MLINPLSFEGKRKLQPAAGSRRLEDSFGLRGAAIYDPFTPKRVWQVDGVYAPVTGRIIGGLRVKLVDCKGFRTFCNQRDLEVLLGIAEPGSCCVWLDQDYAAPGDRSWVGLCVDEEDLADDLLDVEAEARASYGPVLPPGLGFSRRVHDGPGNDFEEELELRVDTGGGLADISTRWISLARTDVRRRSRLWNSVT